ncbi:MAG TPA: alpha/beta hydrolase [Acidimicrobiales bacterium]|nr:alpha/beta hydrolase [Acidimicrobiales bacterium]
MVHPSLEPYVNAVRAEPPTHPSLLSSDERRAAFRELSLGAGGEPVTVESVRDVELELDGRTLAARLYAPFKDESKALVVYFHGGGFVMGDLDTHDALCRRLSSDTRMRFLSVEYRLAPEHPFPAGINDAVDTIRYVLAHLGEFDDPAAELIVMGDSAGATLITVACALTKDEKLGIAAQVVIYPTLGPELFTDSVQKYGDGYGLNIEHLRYDYGLYLDGWSDHSDPRVTPLMFNDLTGAPPAIVVVAECDPLRDEAVAYAGLLEHFGVRVELLEAEGMIHNFLRMPTIVPEAKEIVDDLAKHMHHYVEAAK